MAKNDSYYGSHSISVGIGEKQQKRWSAYKKHRKKLYAQGLIIDPNATSQERKAHRRMLKRITQNLSPIAVHSGFGAVVENLRAGNL